MRSGSRGACLCVHGRYQLSTCARRALHEEKRPFASRGCRPHTSPIVFSSSFLLFFFSFSVLRVWPRAFCSYRRGGEQLAPVLSRSQCKPLNSPARAVGLFLSCRGRRTLLSFRSFFSPAECSTCLPSRWGVLSAECNIQGVARLLTKQGQSSSSRCFIPSAV